MKLMVILSFIGINSGDPQLVYGQSVENLEKCKEIGSVAAPELSKETGKDITYTCIELTPVGGRDS